MKRITSADLAARLQTGSMQQPTEAVVVTHDGKDLFVMLPVADYARMWAEGALAPGLVTEDGFMSDEPNVDLDSIDWNR
jgi:hypothetical protein